MLTPSFSACSCIQLTAWHFDEPSGSGRPDSVSPDPVVPPVRREGRPGETPIPALVEPVVLVRVGGWVGGGGVLAHAHIGVAEATQP